MLRENVLYVYKEVKSMPDLNDLKNIADKAADLGKKAEDAAKKAGISEKDIEGVKDKAIDAAKDIIEKKTGK